MQVFEKTEVRLIHTGDHGEILERFNLHSASGERLTFRADAVDSISAINEKASYIRLRNGIEFSYRAGFDDAVRVFFDGVEPKFFPETGKIKFNPVLMDKVENIGLSVRACGFLKSSLIYFVGDLVTRTEDFLLRIPNCGKKTIEEIKECLADEGLALGMELNDWPPLILSVEEIELQHFHVQYSKAHNPENKRR